MTRITNNTTHYDTLKRRYRDATRVLCEGDSWLAYPRKFLLWGRNANISDYLSKYARRENLIGFNVSSSGDTLKEILLGPQRKKLARILRQETFDILLFSGGGNDLVGNISYLLKPCCDGMSWDQCIHWDRVQASLSTIRTWYEDLVVLVRRNSYNSEIRIVTHTYDIPVLSGKGFSFLGWMLCKPWLSPQFEAVNVTDKGDQQQIIRTILRAFREIVQEVAGVDVVDTQGTLSPADWKDELHPNSQGFRKITKQIKYEIHKTSRVA